MNFASLFALVFLAISARHVGRLITAILTFRRITR